MQMWYKCGLKDNTSCSGFARPATLKNETKGDCYMKGQMPKDQNGNLLVNSDNNNFRSFIKKILFNSQKIIKNIITGTEKSFQ